MTDDSLDRRLQAFAVLSAEERARVATDVETTRPDLAADLADARVLASLLDAAGPDGPDSDLAVRVVDARLGHRPMPLASPEDAEHVAEIQAMLDRFEAEAEAPLAQFERLTGHTLGELVPPEARVNGLQVALDRAAAVPPRTRLWRRAAVLGMVLVVGYSIAFATSAALVPERVQMAEIEDVKATFRPVRSEASDDYAAALDVLDDARQTTLGLFPRYDDATLDAAADQFAAVASDDPRGAFGEEAALAIGRIRMLQGRDDDARIALESVEARRSYRAPEASRLLDYLDAQARTQ